MQKVTMPPNIPQLLALQDPEGHYKPDLEEVEYLTTDGRLLVLNAPDATQLNLLDLRAGETFQVCKRVSGQRGELPKLEVWLTTATERERAEQEKAQGETTPPIPPLPTAYAEQSSLKPRKRRKVHTLPNPQPSFWDGRGTGTYGPAPRPAPVSHQQPPIPFDEAFSQAVKIVQKGLADAGEQWSDASRQGAVSTILIAATKAGWIGPWERNDG
jgi:hypothetical protein